MFDSEDGDDSWTNSLYELLHVFSADALLQHAEKLLCDKKIESSLKSRCLLAQCVSLCHLYLSRDGDGEDLGPDEDELDAIESILSRMAIIGVRLPKLQRMMERIVNQAANPTRVVNLRELLTVLCVLPAPLASRPLPPVISHLEASNSSMMPLRRTSSGGSFGSGNSPTNSLGPHHFPPQPVSSTDAAKRKEQVTAKAKLPPWAVSKRITPTATSPRLVCSHYSMLGKTPRDAAFSSELGADPLTIRRLESLTN